MSTKKQSKQSLKKWEIEALVGINLAFDSNGSVKKDLSAEDKNKAIGILYGVTDNMQPDLAWPFIKLADLIDDSKEKIKLYARAYIVEENIYSMKTLFKHIVSINPKILTDLLD